jgi:hypothetical protein
MLQQAARHRPGFAQRVSRALVLINMDRTRLKSTEDKTVMNKYIFIAFIMTFCLFSETRSLAADLVDEANNQQMIIKYFAEHNAPSELTPANNSKLFVYRIVDAVVHEHLPSAEMIADIKGCDLAYLIDVEIKGSGLKYLYCMNKSVITLMSEYKYNDNAWAKVGKSGRSK